MNKNFYFYRLSLVFCCLAIFCNNDLFAEKLHIKLEWKDTLQKINLTNSSSLEVISFAGSYNGEHLHFLPTFQKEIPISRVGEVSCIISNARYEAVYNNSFSGAEKLNSEVSVLAVASYFKKSPKE